MLAPSLASVKALSWMRWCCDPLRAEKVRLGVRRDDPDFTISSTPWTVAWNSEVRTVATNGSAMIYHLGHGGYLMAPSAIDKRVSDMFVPRPPGKAVDFLRFKEWCGKSWRRSLPCPDCEGLWSEVCGHCLGQGSHSVKCGHCHFSHDCQCSFCGGQGILYCATCVGEKTLAHDPCVINGGVFDRRLIARYLPASGGGVKLFIMGSGGDARLVVSESDHLWQMTVPPITVGIGEHLLPVWQP